MIKLSDFSWDIGIVLRTDIYKGVSFKSYYWRAISINKGKEIVINGIEQGTIEKAKQDWIEFALANSIKDYSG